MKTIRNFVHLGSRNWPLNLFVWLILGVITVAITSNPNAIRWPASMIWSVFLFLCGRSFYWENRKYISNNLLQSEGVSGRVAESLSSILISVALFAGFFLTWQFPLLLMAICHIVGYVNWIVGILQDGDN